MTPYLWAALAATCGVGLELMYRRGLAFWPNVWWIAPTSLLLTFAIYNLVRGGLGWLPGMVAFATMTAGLRLLSVFVITHEPMTPANVIAGGVLLFGAMSRFIWR